MSLAKRGVTLCSLVTLLWLFGLTLRSSADRYVERQDYFQSDHITSAYSNHTIVSTLAEPLAQKRLIFIGDVHGSLGEFDRLVAKLGYDRLKDHIILTGDLVARGRNSLGVVRRARELGASCVRGNHDDKLVRWRGFINRLESQGQYLKEYIYNDEVPDEFDIHGEHMVLAKQLDDADYRFLLSCPIILDIPEHHLHVVHGGLLPGITLQEQNPWDVMNMRNIKKDGTPTKRKSKGHVWVRFWNAAQQMAGQPKTVIYGHDASRGLNVRRYSIGLDSGCVHGGQLTAMLWPGEKYVSVPCEEAFKGDDEE